MAAFKNRSANRLSKSHPQNFALICVKSRTAPGPFSRW